MQALHPQSLVAQVVRACTANAYAASLASGRGGEGLSRRIWAAFLPPASARRGVGTGSVTAQPTGVGARCRPQRGATLACTGRIESSMWG